MEPGFNCRRNKGLSDVLGNILIMVITVSLFSGIFAFVYSMPMPEKGVDVTFKSTFEPASNGVGGWINLTHAGGEPLLEMNIKVIVRMNSTRHNYTISMSNSTDLAGAGEWAPGQTWSRFFGEINPWTYLIVLVLDKDTGDAFFENTLHSEESTFSPEIRNKGYSPNQIKQGSEFTIFATIKDQDGDLDESSIRADLSGIALGSSIPMSYDATTDRYISATLVVPTHIPIGMFYGTIYAQDLEEHVIWTRVELAIGITQAGIPDLYPKAIIFSEEQPTNGDAITITAKIWNDGDGPGQAIINFYLGDINDGTLLGSDEVSVAVGDQSVASIFWEILKGGNHTISVNVTNVYPLEVPNIQANNMSAHIDILPNILIVDDDGYSSADGSARDTAAFMEASIKAAGFEQTTTYRVVGGNGPSYDSGEPKLEDYDIVVWLTGYSVGTLTLTDQTNVGKFLDNGGKLWLVSQGILEDLTTTNTFVNDKLHVFGPYSSTPLDSPLIGNTLHDITMGPPVVTLAMYDRGGLGNTTDIMTIGVDAESMFNNTGGTEVYGVTYKDDNGTEERVAFIPWEFSNILHSDDQAYFAYRVILWLINLTGITGEDIAVSEQTLSSHIALYRDYINVSAVIRNNGANFWNVTVALFIDGDEAAAYPRKTVALNPQGGTASITWNWLAYPVGWHTLSVRADPDNIIQETNENNNELDARSVSKSVYVDYSILVVDDDESGDGTPGNVTAVFAEAMNDIGVGFTRYDRSLGPIGILTLSDYNLVIWLTGANEAETLNESDRDALAAHMDNGGYVWLIGQGIADDLSADSFLSNYLHVVGVSDGALTPDPIVGVRDDFITHGLSAGVDPTGVFPDDGDVLVPDSLATGIFWQDADQAAFNAISYDEDYKLVFFGFELAFIAGQDGIGSYPSSNVSRAEIVFEVLRFMDKPSSNPELKTTLDDMTISNQHPFLGNSYILQTRIYNHGSNMTNALVQYFDGDTQIGSDNVPVMGGGSADLQVIWTPLFAGIRNLTVRVDASNLVDETFEYHNNNVTMSLMVYFFWDDMENGTDNWEHENVIMRINGESPYEYYGKDNVQTFTSIASEWQYTDGVELNISEYHTLGSSWHFEEDNFGNGTVGNSTRTLGTGNTNKSATTPTIDLTDAAFATLRFWHRYDILSSTNGAFIEVGYNDGTGWKYVYASPARPYTGNLLLSVQRLDDLGNDILWGWNGISDAGEGSWEQAEFNLLSYVPATARDQVRIRFNYTQYAPGTGMGWWVDDIEVGVVRSNTLTPSSGTSDVWALTAQDSKSGSHAWNCTDPDTLAFREGLDNVLVTRPIDLTKAKEATFAANVKFNVNSQAGYPPDGFRVEVSDNGGMSWSPLTLAIRASVNVSGTENGDGLTSDTGIDVFGADTEDDGWVQIGTLGRIETDLSGWIGHQIMIRFRVVTNNEPGYSHFKSAIEPYGLLVDDVVVYGNTILG